MAYAIIETGGKQYKVQKNAVIEVEKLEPEKSKSVHFDRVLLFVDGEKIQLGSPVIQGASVAGEVMEQFKADKVVHFRYKRRKGYHKTRGHRQRLTRVKITDIRLK